MTRPGNRRRPLWTSLLLVWAVVGALAVSAAPAASAGGAPNAGSPGVVSLDSGAVRGTVASTYRAFLGIPYAQPPVGDLRWTAPQPVIPWSGVRDATRPGSPCPQAATTVSRGSTNEDCLYLNVYTPAGVSAGAQLPVMFFVHGGAFIFGAGSDYDASNLASQAHVIVVTINYRLGALGFLALPGLTAQNTVLNYGIQDQQAALRWAQRNIGQFGGDRDRVTLFGESAGGTSVCVNLVSPGATGLFQRAIAQSAPCGSEFTTLANGYQTNEQYAQRAGCPNGPAQIACLRGKSAADLLNVSGGGANPLAGGPAWEPVIDGRVLPAGPITLMRSGHFHHMPVMIGTNRDEGRLFTWQVYDAQGKTLSEADYQALLSQAAGSPAAAAVLGAVYSGLAYGSPELALSALVTDQAFAYPTNEITTAIDGAVPTYGYEFNDPNAPLFYSPDPSQHIGAYHSAELQYLFNLPTSKLLTDQQRALSEQMIRYWTNFAATGNPNLGPGGRPDLATGLPEWPRFNALTTPYRNLRPGGKPGSLILGGYQLEHQIPFWSLITGLQNLITGLQGLTTGLQGLATGPRGAAA